MNRTNIYLGECLRWYLKRARHPFKEYLVGHYWPWLVGRRVWVRYDGGAIAVRLDDYLQQRIFFDGEYERPLLDWLRETLRSTDVFWDVGANIGAITIVAARLCRWVIAFEPDPRSVAALKQNLSVNGIDNVEVIAAALGAQRGSATLYQAVRANTGLTSIVRRGSALAGVQEVPLLRADDLVHTRPELAPTVMKIDVEGAEHYVLEGATNLLRSGRLRAVVFEDERDAELKPKNTASVKHLLDARYRIEPFAASDAHAHDAMYNFLATPSCP